MERIIHYASEADVCNCGVKNVVTNSTFREDRVTCKNCLKTLETVQVFKKNRVIVTLNFDKCTVSFIDDWCSNYGFIYEGAVGNYNYLNKPSQLIGMDSGVSKCVVKEVFRRIALYYGYKGTAWAQSLQDSV